MGTSIDDGTQCDALFLIECNGKRGGTEVTSRYYEALRRAIPHLPPDELWWHFERTHALLMANQGKRASITDLDKNNRMSIQTEREWLITFLTGALQSAASDSN